MKLSRETLADRLFDQLRQQVLSGRLTPGDRLPSERAIGEAFGVGRTTVREALGGLVSAGFVERQGRTLVVRDPRSVGELALDFALVASRESVENVYDVRKLVEVHSIRLAAQNRTPEDLEALHVQLGRMDTDDPELYHAADPEFHAAIAKASANEVLYQLFLSSKQVFFKLPAFWRVFAPGSQVSAAPRIGSGHKGHAELLEAIESSDVDLAGQRMRDHLDRVEKGLVAAILAPRVDSDGSPSEADDALAGSRAEQPQPPKEG
jgi:GntR family transcriptional repressor for pyruvate dehydrogenase complex